MIRVNDIVKILAKPFCDQQGNDRARVVKVCSNGLIVVSNMNMPFYGTLSNVQLEPYEVEKVS